LLSISKSKEKKTQRKVAVVNSFTATNGSMKMMKISINGIVLTALTDTGSTHSLLSLDSFKKLNGLTLTPLNMNMKVAGSTVL
jgi:hypothetical protein